jgi:hypothetical protein
MEGGWIMFGAGIFLVALGCFILWIRPWHDDDKEQRDLGLD